MSQNLQAKSTKKSFAEGECNIEEVSGLQQKFSNQILFHFLGIITFGLFYLFALWFQDLKVKIKYTSSQIQNATHFKIKNWDKSISIARKIKIKLVNSIGDEQLQKEAIGFESRFLKYYYNEYLDIFQTVELASNEILKKVKAQGLSDSEYQILFDLFGFGNMQIPVPSYLQLFIQEILNPFFVFQIYSVLLWCYEDYVAFSLVIFSVTVVASCSNLVTIKQNLMKIKEMADHNQDIVAIRKGQKIQTTQKTLVPGDIIEIKDEMQIPVDCILIKGNVLMNESSLTGESIPIFKSAIDKSQFDFELELQESKIKKNSLYCGTKVLQAHQKEEILAVVIRTSFATLRGQLIRSIMFPKPNTFKFFQESMKFLGILFMFVLLGYLIVLPRLYYQLKLSKTNLVVKFLDLITIAVPPQLTAALTVGISFSLQKLEKCQIFCISPPKVVVGGVIDTVCFDKTGTLTEEGMILKGILPCVNKANFYFKIINKKKTEKLINADSSLQNSKFIDQAFTCMSTCHSLIFLKDQLLGDPMEKELFILTQSEFKNFSLDREVTDITRTSNKQKQNYTIVKRFDFSSEAQCMSVIVKHQEQNKTFVFTKGASERINELCLANSMPNNYEKMMENYSQAGYRIISLAFKELENFDENIKRNECESSLIFLGLVFFENPVKSHSEATIVKLNEIQIASVMITGDNILTACEVARTTKIILKNQQVVFCKLDLQAGKIQMNIQQTDNISQFKINTLQSIHWDQSRQKSMFFEDEAIEKNQDQQEYQNNQHKEEIILKEINFQNQESSLENNCIYNFIQDAIAQSDEHIFVMPGNVFAEIMRYIETNKEAQQSPELKSIINRTKVFARMKPNQKTQAIELLQSYNKTVAMVGDGANDCGALKQADVGLSLSQQEASISAPFTSKNLNIDSILDLLRQSRAGLATSFQSFKFMALDSLIEFTATIILYYSFSMPADMQFLYWDFFVSSTLTVTMSMTDACDKLSIEKPPASLLGLQCMMSVFGQSFLQALGQFLMVQGLKREDFFVENDPSNIVLDPDHSSNLPKQTQEVTTIFIYVNVIYLSCVAAINIAKPFRKPFYKNTWFTANYTFLLLYGFSMCMFTWIRIPDLQFDESLKKEWLVKVFFYGIISGIIIFLYEKLICVKLFEYFQNKYKQSLVIKNEEQKQKN